MKTKACKHDRKGELLSLGLANNEMPEAEIRRILGSECNEDIWIRLFPNTDGVVYKLYERPFAERARFGEGG